MDAKRWIVFIVIVVAVIGGMVYVSSQDRLDLSDINEAKRAGIIGPEERNGEIGDHVSGNKDAKVVLVEYGDYQCPGCRLIVPKVKEVTEKYADDVAFVYRNFPITQIHPNARAAAAAVEAAGLQGKFWPMHELVYEKQTDWQSSNPSERLDFFATYADQLGLDTEKFREDVASSQINKKITFDVAVGRLQSVTGTPAFFVNGKSIDDLTENDDAIEDAIKKALKDEGIEVKQESKDKK